MTDYMIAFKEMIKELRKEETEFKKAMYIAQIKLNLAKKDLLS